MKQHAINVGDATFYGFTKTDAKKTVAEVIDAAFTGTYVPQVIPYRGNLLVLYRDTLAWRYRILWADNLKDGSAHRAEACVWSSDTTFETVYRQATLHLAQQAWRPTDADTMPAFLPADAYDEFRSWVRFQSRYAYFKAQGHSPDVCHAMAGDSRYEAPSVAELAQQAA